MLYAPNSNNGSITSDAIDFVEKVFEPVTGSNVDYLNNNDGGGSVIYAVDTNGDGVLEEKDGVNAGTPGGKYTTIGHTKDSQYVDYTNNAYERLTWSKLVLVRKKDN